MTNYIGNIPSQGEFKKLDSIASSFDGSTTQFNLNYSSVSQSVGGAEQLIVSLNGVIQEPLSAYTLGIGGSSIVFASAPASGDTCHIVLFGGVGGTLTPSDQSVTAEKLAAELKDYYEDEFTADGSTTDFTLSRESVGVNQLMLTVDGVVQPTSAYSASGTTLTISPALPNGTNIRVVHMGVKSGVFVPAQNSIGLTELDLTAIDARYYQSGDSINVTSITSENITADGIIKSARDNYSKVSLANTGTPYEYQVENNGSNFRITDSTAGQTRVAINTTGYVGVNTIAPGGRFHVVGTGGSTGGTVQNSGSGNQIVIENNASGGSADFQMLGPTNGYNHIFFGDADDANIGVIYYNHNNNSLNFTTNANTGSMILDSAGSFMIANTVANPASGFSNQAGAGWYNPNKHFEIATTENRPALEVGKNNTTGGSLIALRRLGTTVGQIGVKDPDIWIGSGETNLKFQDGSYSAVVPANSDGSDSHGDIDLGYPGTRAFRHLYLSGGIQFDSRSSKLDDYEEGYWFPYLEGSTGGSITGWIERMGWYVKVGGVCHAHFYLANPGSNSGLSGQTKIMGLPFTSKSNASQGYGTNYYSNGVIAYNRGISHVGSYLSWDIGNGHNYGRIRAHYTNGTESATLSLTSVATNLLLRGAISYQVD